MPLAISSVRHEKKSSPPAKNRRSNAPSRSGGAQPKRPAPSREQPATKDRPSPKDRVTLNPRETSSPSRAEGTRELSRGLRDNYSSQSSSHAGHHHGGHGPHGGGHNHDNHYWTGPLLFNPPPGFGKLPDKPPEGLSPAEQQLWEHRRGQSQPHVDWHGDWVSRGQNGHSTKDKVDFFDFHRRLIDDDNRRRQELGLAPLGPMDPPPPRMLHPTMPDGTPVPDPDDPSKPMSVTRPDPLDEKYRGNFDLFFEDMRRYHDTYHVMNADIASPVTNVLEDHFYQFHHWIEQQYQRWRDANPGWRPPG